MKIIISGKGGSGKSTIAILVAKALKEKGYRVLLIDADESNACLHQLLGIQEQVVLLDNLGGKKAFKKKMNQTFPPPDDFFYTRTKIDDIPEENITEAGGIKLLTMGKIHHSGEGCACPIGVLSKKVLSNLEIGDNEVVVIDAEAGVEHFGRGLDTNCDLILGVVDPTFESFTMAGKMLEMAEKAGINISLILNKVDTRVEKAMSEQVDQSRVLVRIPYDEDIFMASLEGKELQGAISEFDNVCSLVDEFKKD